ncbi:MAG: sugar-binding domain-containing protein [Elusimicrobiota bacterium]
MVVSKAVPRNEYPRPQMVRREWLNLNGEWDYELFLEKQAGNETIRTEFSKKIVVPFCPESELSGINEKRFIPESWYHRKFVIPQEWKDKHVILHFGAVDYLATVWVNNKKIGMHRGGYTPFSFDITDCLVTGNNDLTLFIIDNTTSELQPTGKQSKKPESYECFYTRVTGIWQTVWLEPVEADYIKTFRVYPDYDNTSIIFKPENVITSETEGITQKVEVFANGKAVGKTSFPAKNTVYAVVKLDEKYPWEPGSPFLYDVVITLEKDGKAVDRVESYFGLRKIEISGKKVLLNGKSVFQRLVLDQGYYPDGIYTASTEAALKQDIVLSMELGFNGARLHQKVFEPRYLYWADKLGYLVWGEYPSWGLDLTKYELFDSVMSEWMEAVERDFNHPSIIGWCPFNETYKTQIPELLSMGYNLTKKLDHTRPVIDTSGYVHVLTDIYDSHNYTQDPEKFKALFEKFKDTEEVFRNHPAADAPYLHQPYFVSEYGGIWWNPAQATEDKKSWGYGARPKDGDEFIERYKKLTEVLLFHPKMFAFCYTQIYDVEQEVNGLLTYDRKPKFDKKIFRKVNTQKAAIED